MPVHTSWYTPTTNRRKCRAVNVRNAVVSGQSASSSKSRLAACLTQAEISRSDEDGSTFTVAALPQRIASSAPVIFLLLPALLSCSHVRSATKLSPNARKSGTLRIYWVQVGILQAIEFARNRNVPFTPWTVVQAVQASGQRSMPPSLLPRALSARGAAYVAAQQVPSSPIRKNS